MNKINWLMSLAAVAFCCMYGCNKDATIGIPQDAICETSDDCEEGHDCEDNVCTTCDDGVKNGDETGVDCGGSCKESCDDDVECEDDDDCGKGYVCKKGVCKKKKTESEDNKPSCSDDKKNGDETDVDCGGSCDKCANNEHCDEDSDCMSNHCDDGICKAKVKVSCTDDKKNGDETDVDCGGSCGKCAADMDCDTDSDCISDNCEDGICKVKASCTDGEQSDDETDVDCGGSCNKCADDMHCDTNSDCMSDNCEEGTCKAKANASCTDGEQGDDETDVDCGGSCNKCADDMHCNTDSDCVSDNCEEGTCKAKTEASCTDGEKNGDETDVDCGGSCDKCAENMHCDASSDCLSDNCEEGTCKIKVDPCADGVLDGNETDIDCGGSCGKCGDGKTCNSGADCANGFCDANKCTSCSDGVLNGNEADVDCGGRCGANCAAGKACHSDSDCATYNCVDKVCKSIDCPDVAQPGEIIINEVFANPNTESKMEHSNNKQMKYIELYNKSDKKLQLYNLSLTFGGNEVHAKGCISAKSYLIIYPSGQKLKALDLDAKTLASDNIEKAINATSGDVKLVKRADSTVIHSAKVPETKKGTSAGRDKAEKDSKNDEALVPHSSVKTIESGVKNLYSPGLPNKSGFPMG